MTGNEYVIWFEAEKCIQCHGCETACKSWRNLEYGVRYRRVSNLWQGLYPRITSSTLSLACLHCLEPACAAACPEQAIAKRSADGRVLVDEQLCTGCGTCCEACPYGVPQISSEMLMGKCDLCIGQTTAEGNPPCVDTCPGQALSVRQLDRSQKSDLERTILQLLKGNQQAR